MTEKVSIHKGKEQFPNLLWWKPLFAWQKQMNDALQSISPTFVPPTFWDAEDSIFGDWQQNINRLFGEMFNNRQMFTPWWTGSHTEPYIDIVENNKAFIVKADVPGVDAEDLDVSVSEQGALIIKGERKDCHEEKESEYLRRECCSGSFSRIVALPEGADLDNAAATFDRNVLTVDVPKKAEVLSTKARKLKIAANEQKQKKAA